MKKIGILGGTFDPPHIGHFIIADEVKHKMGLDEIWFIPTNEPPHKKRAASSNEHRLEMLRRATEQTEYFKVNTIEMERIGRSYTIDTIDELKGKYPDALFYFIIGADMVEYLPNWKRIDELIQKIQFVGVNRPGFAAETDYHVKMVDCPLIDISSTEIRKRVGEHLPVNFLLPKEAVEYIKEQRLYERR